MQKKQSLLSSKILVAAPIWRRIAAILYDSLLVIAIILTACLFKAILFSSLYNMGISFNINIENMLFSFFLVLLIITFFHYFWHNANQTLGMKAWNLYIYNSNNSQITLKQTIIRCLVAVLSISCLFIGILWIVFDKYSRSWQDIASDSITGYHKK